MNKTQALLLALVSLLPSLSHADPYEERRALSIQKERQQEEANYFSWMYSHNVKAQRVIHSFIAAHGGQRTDGTCKGYVGGCRGPICSGQSEMAVAVSGIEPNAGYYLTDCRLDLNNGLACQIHSLLWPEKGGYVTDCYDAAGNERRFYLGAGKAASPKRKKR
jgi:hypothetical protein